MMIMSHSTLDGINHDPEVGHLEDMCQESDDETSFMARQPRQIHYKEMNPRETVLDQVILLLHMKVMSLRASSTSFSLQAPMYAARVRTDSWPHAHSQIRHVLGLGRHDIQYIHVAPYRPADLYAADTLVAVVQRVHDLQPGDHRRIVLIDIVFHEHAVEATMTHRYATLVRKDLTRRILLERAQAPRVLQTGETSMHCSDQRENYSSV